MEGERRGGCRVAGDGWPVGIEPHGPGRVMLREGLAIIGVLVSIVSVFAFWVAMRRAPLSVFDCAE